MSFPIGAQILDACVLAVLEQGDTYGYELTQRIRQATDVSESTLYPVLRRLQKDGFLSTYDQPYQGRNRRYYQITELGSMRLEHDRKQWTQFKQSVEQLLLRGTEQ